MLLVFSKGYCYLTGIGYSDLPVIRGVYKREIDRAELDVNLAGSGVGTINVISGGNRYISPTAYIVDAYNRGSGAIAEVNVTDGVVTSVNVLEAGAGYIEPVVVLVEQMVSLYRPHQTSEESRLLRSSIQAETSRQIGH